MRIDPEPTGDGRPEVSRETSGDGQKVSPPPGTGEVDAQSRDRERDRARRFSKIIMPFGTAEAARLRERAFAPFRGTGELMSVISKGGSTKVSLVDDDIGELKRNDRMAVDWWPIDKLRQDERSPRRYSKKELKKAEDIIRRFGVRLPVVISADGCVVAHFIAVAAAKRAGITQLPVVYADDLPEPERRALSLALNRLYELGDFDQRILGDLLLDFEVTVPDLDFGDIGFDQGEVDRAIRVAQQSECAEEVPVEVGASAVSRLGDVWLLGEHRIACGDATARESYTALLNGEVADMVFTDPPYGCAVNGFVTSRKHREFVEASGEKDAPELSIFFRKICEALGAYVRPGAVVDLCIDWRSQHLLQEAALPIFGPLLNLAVWVKDRAGMGSFLRSQHELVLIYAAGGGKPRNNVELGRHGRHRSNVWKYPSAMTFGRSGVEGDLLDDHPTPKPKEMIADAILDCTNRGEVVLDPFLGSGSTLIAAETTGRRCRGMDLDPLYVDLTARRWQNWTGRSAVHAATGRSFDDTAGTATEAQDGEE